jgi:hypothetical protein
VRISRRHLILALRWTLQDPTGLATSDSTLFWSAMVASSLLWALFAVSAALSLKFSWLLIVGIAMSLNCSNLVGYFKCRKDAAKQLQGMVAQGALTALTSGAGTLRCMHAGGSLAIPACRAVVAVVAVNDGGCGDMRAYAAAGWGGGGSGVGSESGAEEADDKAPSNSLI